MKQRIVFFGAGPYVGPIIETLRKNFSAKGGPASGWELALVVTTERNPRDSVLNLCSKSKIKSIPIGKFNSQTLISQLSSRNSRIAVLAYFGLIIPREILELFPLGIINVHPSLLPKYRGATPGQAAILAGDSITGVSIIKLDEEVDHGPILAQVEEKIEPNDTSETLYKRLFQKGAELLSQVLPKYITGELKPVEQDHSTATLTERLTRNSGFIDFTKQPQSPQNPQLLDRMIRAYYPWPGVWFQVKLNGVERIVKLFPEQKIQVEGKNIMKLSDFANGYPEAREVLARLSLS